MEKYPKSFTDQHIDQALSEGFSNPKISTWQGRPEYSRIELDYKTEGQTYSVAWQLAGPGGFAGAMMFTPHGGDDQIRDAEGNSCGNFASFSDFMHFALTDIARREKRRIDAILSEQAYQAQVAKNKELWATCL